MGTSINGKAQDTLATHATKPQTTFVMLRQAFSAFVFIQATYSLNANWICEGRVGYVWAFTR